MVKLIIRPNTLVKHDFNSPPKKESINSLRTLKTNGFDIHIVGTKLEIEWANIYFSQYAQLETTEPTPNNSEELVVIISIDEQDSTIGKLILFNSERYPNWSSITYVLLNK